MRKPRSAHQLKPPTVKATAMSGMLAIIYIIMWKVAELTFPLITCIGVITVVSSMSKVCFSLSEVIADAVSMGIMSESIPSSTAPITGNIYTSALYVSVYP